MTACESVLNDLPAKKTGCPGDSNMHRFSNTATKGGPQYSLLAVFSEHGRDRALIRERSVEPVKRETVSGAIGRARINFFVSSYD